MIEALDRNRILVLCVLGSLFRLIYGAIYEHWMIAPDHQAWELILEQGSFQYSHLIHYPHEGGTIIISLISQLIEVFTDFSSLTISALIIDFLVRFLQINIVDNLFGKQVALFFGIWTIFATPSIIPWGTMIFGLHAVSSIFPFLLILLLSKNRDTAKHHLRGGLFLGLAVWFSYSNLILIPVYFLYYLVGSHKFKNWLYAALSLAGVLLLHVLVRQFLDAGFHLSETGLMSIRGVSFSITDIDVLNRISSIPRILANSATTLVDPLIPIKVSQLVYYLLCVLSLIGFFLSYKSERVVKSVYVMAAVIVLFFATYLLSPFYYARDAGSYMAFRHLTYITPLVALFLITGLFALKQKWIVVSFLVFGLFQSSQLFTFGKKQKNDINIKAIGWVLGTKFGHNPDYLTPIIKDNAAEEDLLVKGIGWGITTSIMSNDKKSTEHKIKQLNDLFFEYPPAYQDNLLKGIRFSFSDAVTPRLNKAMLNKIEHKMSERSATRPKQKG